jgi:NADH pyrophosphatase NudC (nudix superfamily)
MRAGKRLEESMEIDPNIAVLAVLTSGVGYLMVVAGVHKSLLEWRRSERLCPSCGRAIQSRVCSFCTGS